MDDYSVISIRQDRVGVGGMTPTGLRGCGGRLAGSILRRRGNTPFQVSNEFGHMCSDEGPYQIVIDVAVLTGQDISLRNDASPRDTWVGI